MSSVQNPVQHNGQHKLGTPSSSAVQGSEAVPIADPDEREGWLFQKPVANTDKFNYFFYGGTGDTEPLKLKDIHNVSVVCAIDNYQAQNSLPWINIYTKPTGSGDAGAFYHSKISGHLHVTGHHIAVGESIQMYLGTTPTVDYGYRMVKTNRFVEGQGHANEDILYIVVQSDSGAPVGTQILVSNLSYETIHKHKIKRKIKLIA
jgi:hypothetical protein